MSQLSPDKYCVISEYITSVSRLVLTTRNIKHLGDCVGTLVALMNMMNDSVGPKRVETELWRMTFQGNFIEFHIASEVMVHSMSHTANETGQSKILRLIVELIHTSFHHSRLCARLGFLAGKILSKIDASKVHSFITGLGIVKTYPLSTAVLLGTFSCPAPIRTELQQSLFSALEQLRTCKKGLISVCL